MNLESKLTGSIHDAVPTEPADLKGSVPGVKPEPVKSETVSAEPGKSMEPAKGPTASVNKQQPEAEDNKANPMVPMTIAGTNQHNDPEMSAQRVKELKDKISAAKRNNKPVRKNAAKPKPQTATKSKAKAKSKKSVPKETEDENTLDSEEELSTESPIPEPSPEVEELDEARYTHTLCRNTKYLCFRC